MSVLVFNSTQKLRTPFCNSNNYCRFDVDFDIVLNTYTIITITIYEPNYSNMYILFFFNTSMGSIMHEIQFVYTVRSKCFNINSNFI